MMAGLNIPPIRSLHWLIAVLALTALGSGYALTRPGVFSSVLLQIHLVAGASTGILSLARVLIWFTYGAPPALNEATTPLQAGLARSVHILLRLVPILLLASGAGMLALSGRLGAVVEGSLQSLEPFETLRPRDLHHTFALLLACLIGLHSLAALWHRLRFSGVKTG